MSEEVVIGQALKILENRLREPGAVFNNSKSVTDYLKLQISSLEHESFRVYFLNSQHALIGEEELAKGTLNTATVYPREVVKAALRHNAAAVVFAHNHPSGKSTPSDADKQITIRLKKALNLIDVLVLDHFIVGDDMFSFAEHGLMSSF